MMQNDSRCLSCGCRGVASVPSRSDNLWSKRAGALLTVARLSSRSPTPHRVTTRGYVPKRMPGYAPKTFPHINRCIVAVCDSLTFSSWATGDFATSQKRLRSAEDYSNERAMRMARPVTSTRPTSPQGLAFWRGYGPLLSNTTCSQEFGSSPKLGHFLSFTATCAPFQNQNGVNVDLTPSSVFVAVQYARSLFTQPHRYHSASKAVSWRSATRGRSPVPDYQPLMCPCTPPSASRPGLAAIVSLQPHCG
jgi:hypothetical protein